MGDDSILDTLWKAKFTLLLALMLLVAAATASIVYTQKRSLQDELSSLQSDYNTLNDKYNNLVTEHAKLTADHDSLNTMYNDLNDKYNKLSVNYSYLQSSLDNMNGQFTSLNNTVSSFEESGGATIALAYGTYVNSATPPKRVVDATAYNVGSSRANRVYVRCKIQDNNTISTQTQEFDNLDPIHKGHAHWEFNSTVLIQSVWVDVA
jgi:cell division protein FtsL